ncbi:FAD-dependent oxidoreductase [Singulisphaera sp. PoT]|uniref:FAD-dependent oxidoreductase n=1 Tax=Singulisphaera sp. PoT TaxID=3411797 RepID=UPI003BF4B59F
MPRERQADILIVGAGPAGIAAALGASRGGGRVLLIDENPAPGGQIWRGEAAKGSADRHKPADAWLRRLSESDVEIIPGARVFAAPGPGSLCAETHDGRLEIAYDRLILATGARERLLPFPGWTLPNVMAAGGLQALVKGGLPIAGRSVVIAGSGPLLLAVAANLKQKGAKVRVIAEQASFGSVVGFGLGLVGSPSKLVQALGLKRTLAGIPQRLGCWPVEARGEGRLASVTLTDGKTTWDEPCDYLGCGFGLVPNTELPRLLGCEVGRGVVTVDDWQRTTVEGIYCAGESTGIGGVEKSLLEGEIAGLAAAEKLGEAKALFPTREKARAFATRLERAFALRDELRNLPQPETIICRCEDVTLAQLAPFHASREAKLQTRCGMGPCQGRICGPAVAFLKQWPADSIRPPILPVRMENLVAAKTND